MKSSESIIKIASALLKAQKKMGAATKDAKNPFYRSNYADYGSVLEVAKEPLNDEGITILQPHHSQDGKTFVETVLVHESGEWVSSQTEVICAKQNDPQALGSAITYARRYSLQSLLAIPAVDDDAELNMNRPSTTKASTQATQTTPTQATSAPVTTSPVDEVPKSRTKFNKPPRTTPAVPVAESSDF